jgi:hypothetical protein
MPAVYTTRTSPGAGAVGSREAHEPLRGRWAFLGFRLEGPLGARRVHGAGGYKHSLASHDHLRPCGGVPTVPTIVPASTSEHPSPANSSQLNKEDPSHIVGRRGSAARQNEGSRSHSSTSAECGVSVAPFRNARSLATRRQPTGRQRPDQSAPSPTSSGAATLRPARSRRAAPRIERLFIPGESFCSYVCIVMVLSQKFTLPCGLYT